MAAEPKPLVHCHMRGRTSVHYHLKDRKGPHDKVAFVHRIEAANPTEARELLQHFESVLVPRFRVSTVCFIVDVAVDRKATDVLERLNLLTELGYRFTALEHLADTPKGQSVRLMCEKEIELPERPSKPWDPPNDNNKSDSE